MLHIDCARWGQTPEDLRRLATEAPHPRTRERFLALYEITQTSCATRVAPHTQRHPQTVMGWVHAYNEQGPAALAYRRPFDKLRRRPPPFCPHIEAELGAVIDAARCAAAAPPIAGADPPPRWTLRRLVAWVRERFGLRCCRETIRAALRRLDQSWKKAKKLLGRADPDPSTSSGAASLRQTDRRPAGRRATRLLPAGLLGRGAYPSRDRSRLWLGTARSALLGHLHLAGPVGQALLLWALSLQ